MVVRSGSTRRKRERDENVFCGVEEERRVAAEEEVRGEGEGRGREKKSLLKMQAMSEWGGGAGVSEVPSSSLLPPLFVAGSNFFPGRKGSTVVHWLRSGCARGGHRPKMCFPSSSSSHILGDPSPPPFPPSRRSEHIDIVLHISSKSSVPVLLSSSSPSSSSSSSTSFS